MAKYEELIEELKSVNPEEAARLEEEMNIIVHKLKFLPTESFSNVILLKQQEGFEPYTSTAIAEKVKIAGGNLTDSLDANPDKIIIVQQDESLYSTLPLLLNQPAIIQSKAFANNAIYIIHNAEFDKEDALYLSDIEILAEILQPKYFFYGRDGIDWVKFEIN
ncbi:substrate-binding domain-containing protein [Sphingobacterium pedocola]|uniref:ABC transporter substrate-binding protein n=1 Tax=Sphingobacterium pedocola TaxID=2082722 RepID=A0ABR9TEW2_9SPHI|nr:ABC transporter substrate-binding protein [Sphingobacterium pedocola]MBE8723217.1 ABC transporter substrate-binding protein [Sphingobacterium pedocola]